MDKAFTECKELIVRNALHRKGFRLGDVSYATQLQHTLDEVHELIEAKTPDDRLKELGDVFGCLIHVAIKNGFTEAQIEEQILAKWRERFQ